MHALVLRLIVLSLTVLLISSGGTAYAGTLFGIGAGRQLVTIDPATGAATAVGQVGSIGSISGIAFDPSGNLFGVRRFSNGATTFWELMEIDTTTGSPTLIGAISNSNSTTGPRPFSLASDGSGGLFAAEVGNQARLFRIDPTTLIGPTVLSTVVASIGLQGFQGVRALALGNDTSTLFGADLQTQQLVSFNTTTFAGTAVGSLGFGSVNSLSFDSSGTLFGIDTGSDQLLTISTVTGAATPGATVRLNGADVSVQAIAFAPQSTSAVPEPATFGLFGIGGIGLAAVAIGRRHRRAATMR